MKTIINLTDKSYIDKLFDLSFSLYPNLTKFFNYKSINNYADYTVFIEHFPIDENPDLLGIITGEVILLTEQTNACDTRQSKLVSYLFKTSQNKDTKLSYMSVNQSSVDDVIKMAVPTKQYEELASFGLYDTYVLNYELLDEKQLRIFALLPPNLLVIKGHVSKFADMVIDDIRGEMSEGKTKKQIIKTHKYITDFSYVYAQTYFKPETRLMTNYVYESINSDIEYILSQDKSRKAIAVYLPYIDHSEQIKHDFITKVNEYLQENKYSSNHVYLILHEDCDDTLLRQINPQSMDCVQLVDLCLDVICMHHEENEVLCPDNLPLIIYRGRRIDL